MGVYGEEENLESTPFTKPTNENIIQAIKPHLEILSDVSEEDGRKNLMSIFDQQIKHVDVEEVKPKKSQVKTPPQKPQLQGQTQTKSKASLDKSRVVEERLTQFLKKIQKRALDYQARS